MSDWQSKLEKQKNDGEYGYSENARCLFKKHLCYQDGTPKGFILMNDAKGPLVFEQTTMGVKTRWKRIGIIKGDLLMERCDDREDGR